MSHSSLNSAVVTPRTYPIDSIRNLPKKTLFQVENISTHVELTLSSDNLCLTKDSLISLLQKAFVSLHSTRMLLK